MTRNEFYTLKARAEKFKDKIIQLGIPKVDYIFLGSGGTSVTESEEPNFIAYAILQSPDGTRIHKDLVAIVENFEDQEIQ